MFYDADTGAAAGPGEPVLAASVLLDGDLHIDARQRPNVADQPAVGPQDLDHAPLAGIRVLDFSTLLPGPLATLMLAEAGMKRDFANYNRLYAEYFKTNPPCRTTVEVVSLPTAGNAPINFEVKILRDDLSDAESAPAAPATAPRRAVRSTSSTTRQRRLAPRCRSTRRRSTTSCSSCSTSRSAT